MNKSEQINELAKALAEAQAELKNPPLDSENPHFKSRFCSLAGARDAIIPVLAKHGLSLIQSAGSDERGPKLVCLLMHTSGQWVETDPLTLPASKQDAQGYGSALTYGRRYTLMALAGVVGDADDDGQSASRPPPAAATLPNEQVKELLQLLDRKGFSVKSLCRRYKVRRLSALTPEQYAESKKGLEALADKRAEKPAPAPPQQPPAQKPAPAVGDHDPAELIGREEAMEIARLLQTGGLQWADCRKALGIPESCGIRDCAYGELPTVLEWLRDHQPKKGA